MKLSDEFIAKARKDWENEEIEAVGDFQTYLAGYIACLKRFGGNNERVHPRPLGSNRNRK